MNGITHKQAKRYMRADLDGLLNVHHSRDLEAHLRECEACRAESETLFTLAARLQGEFHARWDAQNGPSTNVMANVHSQTRRIAMSNRVNTGLKTLAGMAVLLVLGFGLNVLISQLRDRSVAPDGTIASDNNIPVNSLDTNGRLLAFTSKQDGNLDVYTIRADGSDLTNITNNPAEDVNPFWSPDGKRIAFESDRDGFMQIYLMNANGTDVIQLTHNEADHGFNVSDSPWSPDGSRLIFTERAPEEEKWMLYAVGMDGQNKTPLVEVPDIYNAISWSPDGEYIAFIILEPHESRDLARIHVVDVNGNNLTNATKLVPADEDLSWNYSWSRDGQFISFIGSRYAWENGNGRYAAYEASLDGETLMERATSSTPMDDWRDGTSFITGFDASTLTWLRSDGTYNTLKPFEKCQMADDSQHSSIYERSSDGNLVYGANCPNGDWWFYWAIPDGTVVKQLLNSPITFSGGSITDIVWSPDNRFLALNVASPDRTDRYIYILNVEKALKDPLTQPEQIVVEAGTINFNISWQPIP